MKHFKLHLHCIWAVLLLLISVRQVNAENVEIDGICYILNSTNRTAVVTYQTTGTDNYSALPANVVIPESVVYNAVSFSVIEIADRAFRNCTSLESISIPGTVTSVGTTATATSSSTPDNLPFYKCTSLKTVRFEDGSQPVSLGVNNYNFSSSSYYGYGLFRSCPLEEVYIGRNIVYSDYSTSYKFAKYPERYGYSAFYGKTHLTKVVIGQNVTSIPPYVFYECDALSLVDFGSSLVDIPENAFNGCKLTDLRLPGSVTSIGHSAFKSNTTLVHADLSTSVTTIGDNAFDGCSYLSDIRLGNSLMTIGDYAFQSAGSSSTNWQPIILPETLVSIGERAFYQSGVPSIVIPGSVAEIGIEAFASNTKLNSVTVESGCKVISEGEFSDCSNLSIVSLSEGLTTISNRAFRNCTSLESISIPGTVTGVGTTVRTSSSTPDNLPFYKCTSLKTVRFEDGSQPISLGVNNRDYSSGSNYGYGLFYSCPLEEVYIGRNIVYSDYSTSYKFANYPDRYGYSAFYNQPKLAKVTVSEAVTEIPAYLFYKNTSVTLMSLPKTRQIGTAAFKECSKLTTLNLGTDLETVGSEAFYGCSNVTKLTFPNTVTTIGGSAFYNCSSVTEVTVGSELKEIGGSAFYGCESLTAFILPDAFTTMGESAFEGCSKLTVAKLGTSLTAVPAKAFKNCIALSEMIVPATAKSIGDQAFYNDSGLATMTMNEGLETIGSEVFYNNSGIMQFSIPGTVASIGANSFYGCTRTTYLTFRDGDGILSINNTGCRSSKVDAVTSNSTYRCRKYDYFYDCPIRFLTIGRNITYQHSASVSIYNPDTKQTETRASAPFLNSKDLRSVKIGSKVTFLYNHLLNGCSNVTSLTFPSGLQKVYRYAFANCTGLKELDFPQQLVLLDGYACYNNANLASVVFREESGNNLKFKIGDYTFGECPLLTTLTFPAKTTSIGNYCFYDTPMLTEIKFVDSPNAVSLGYGAKADAAQNITLDSEMPLFGNSRLQKLYMGRNIDYSLHQYGGYDGYSPFYNQVFLTDVKFSQAGTVTYCKDYLLYKVSNCEQLILPESLTSIGNYTFSGMAELDKIVIPNSVTEIGTYAFSGDKSLKAVKLSTSCPWLKAGLFSDCDSLAAITIPTVVTKMDTKMFANCKLLANVIFEDAEGLIEMAYGAANSRYGLFWDCPVETLHLGRWLSYDTQAPEHAPFYSISQLKNLTIGEHVGVIDKYMFSYCTGLEDVYLPDNIESVGLWGFRGCSSLKSIRFGEKLSQIADYGFSECTSLDNVSFPASMTSVADNSFSNCTSLKKLDLGEKLMIIGPSAFKNCSALEGIEIPETLYGLGVESFANCTSLPNVSVKSVSSVGKQTFQGCTGLKWVSLSDKTTSLGENSFDGCTGIGYVKSYAEMPPEGLVNFPADVVANGTLFVPEESVEYYQYSPTWEVWTDIRTLNNNIMVSSVVLDRTEVLFKASETVQINATVGADDATDKAIIWRTSDSEVATVDATGVVTAVAVGDAVITAAAADGSGVKAECMVTVEPTMVESVTVSAETASLKKGRSIGLSALVMPATATNRNVSWISSDESIAGVDASGVVTAVSAGVVEISASALDGSGIQGVFELTVVPPTKGDSNDNDAVTITDAVNTANYAVGNEVDNFCFEAADVNEDNRVTLADASATVTIILNQAPESVKAKTAPVSRAAIFEQDCLVIDNYTADAGQGATVGICLDNTVGYVALQADILLPEGLALETVRIGSRVEASHKLQSKRIDDRRVRVTLFDVDNSEFAATDDAIIELVVKANAANTGSIVLDNIIASDSKANEYALGYMGGNNIGMSGVDSVYEGDISVKVENGVINILNASGREIAIYAVDGTTLTRFVARAEIESRSVVPGVYIVTVDNNVMRVVVK